MEENRDNKQEKERLVCPSCRSALPFYFAFASGVKKKICPACHACMLPTRASMEKIHRDCGLISFIAGIPLGGLCFYIWTWMSQPGFAMLMLLLGITGVVHSCYLHAKTTIRFQPG